MGGGQADAVQASKSAISQVRTLLGTMELSSLFDHCVVDDMNAPEFVQKIRGYLESPATLFVE
jgi:pyruvate/2-oxoglutarate dehydrogenase complex dihydrolipoamide acyltransferase (E2) component